MTLTDEGLLTKLLRLTIVLLPLKQCQGLVDQRQHIHVGRLLFSLHLHGGVKAFNGFLVLLLVEQELAIVVVHIWYLLEVLDGASEGSHGGGHRAHLVLGDAKLDVRVDEILVQINRLLVVLGCVDVFTEDEVQLGAVVVYVGVVFVLFHGQLEIICCCLFAAELELHAGAFDICLRQRRLLLNGSREVLQRTFNVALEVGECRPHVQGECFVLAQITQLKGFLEAGRSLFVSRTCLLAHGYQTLLQLPLACVLIQLGRFFKTSGRRLRTETLEVVRDECCAGQLLGL